VAFSTRDENGYATAAFGAIALSLAVIAAALLAFANFQLRTARIGLRQAQQDAVLDGALVLAAKSVMQESRTAPLAWSGELDGTAVTFLAEPEALKASAQHPEVLGAAALARLTSEEALSAPVPPSALGSDRRALVNRAKSQQWRSCAQSFLSPLSASEAMILTRPSAPMEDSLSWRVGEVWRLAAYAEGRGADAIVRFTGDPGAPFAVLDMWRGSFANPDSNRCYDLVQGGAR
jgi:hypothetical protein